MRNFLIPSLACVLVVCGSASALSNVTFILETGGNPNVASYEQGGWPVYVRGDTTAKTVATGATINWDVAVTVSGTHSGGTFDNAPVAGLANSVFTLTLKKDGVAITTLGHAATDANGTATGAGWYSLINDGDGNGASGTLRGPDEVYNAAFPSVFTVTSVKSGRVIDLAGGSDAGGPGMDQYQYPSATGLQVRVGGIGGSLYGTGGTLVSPTNCSGQLVGMGAGYKEFYNTDAGGTSLAGIGLTGSVGTGTGACTGLGTKALFEGQLSTIGLASGTYTLELTAGTGTNVMPWVSTRCDASAGYEAFAVKPNTTTTNAVTFVIGVCCSPLSIVSSKSVKTHGPCGDFGVPSGSWEGRVSSTQPLGPSRIVTVFNQNIQRVTGLPTDVSVSSGVVGGIGVTVNTLTVYVSGITNGETFRIWYPGIAAVYDINARTAQTNCWQVLAGEASGPICLLCVLAVNSSDYIAVRGQVGLGCVTIYNFRQDVNCDGAINSSDYIAIRGMIDPRTLPSQCE